MDPPLLIQTITLSFSSSSGRPILSNISLDAFPGQLLAIVGPSGAGKSTLLSALAGSLHPPSLSGSILVNGRPPIPPSFLRSSGFVAQDDTALFPFLTLEESLTYAARLRLRCPLSHAALRARSLLSHLGLSHLARSHTASISGGQRRRVSIGVELVHDPPVLLLDEPTSGLDSSSARHVVDILHLMAVEHTKTVIFTVHQPGFRILDQIHRIALISNGNLMFQGTISLLQIKLDELGHLIPPHVNVVEYAIDVVDVLRIETQIIQGTKETKIPVLNKEKINWDFANSRVKEIGILAERFGKIVIRTKQVFLARMIQSVVAGLLLGTIFMNAKNNEAKIGFFAFSLTFLLSSSVEGLPIFLMERRILMKEASRGAYRVSSYVISNFLVFFPVLLMASVLYSAPVYWLIGLRGEIGNFVYFVIVIWLAMLNAHSIVACFGALVPNFLMGNSVIGGLMGAFFLFSGYFITKKSIPKYWIFMHYLSLFKYPFEAFLINEYGGEKGREECVKRGENECFLNGEMLLREQGMEESHRWSNIGVMIGFICIYRFLCWLILWIRCFRIRK